MLWKKILLHTLFKNITVSRPRTLLRNFLMGRSGRPTKGGTWWAHWSPKVWISPFCRISSLPKNWLIWKLVGTQSLNTEASSRIISQNYTHCIPRHNKNVPSFDAVLLLGVDSPLFPQTTLPFPPPFNAIWKTLLLLMLVLLFFQLPFLFQTFITFHLTLLQLWFCGLWAKFGGKFHVWTNFTIHFTLCLIFIMVWPKEDPFYVAWMSRGGGTL